MSNEIDELRRRDRLREELMPTMKELWGDPVEPSDVEALVDAAERALK